MGLVADIPMSIPDARIMLRGLVRVNRRRLRAKPRPALYERGVRYRREAGERWKNVDQLDADGEGDCEDLAAARAAELQESGEDPDADADIVPTRPGRYHAIVIRGDGSREDPSRILIKQERASLGAPAGGTMSKAKSKVERPGPNEVWIDDLGEDARGVRRIRVTLPVGIATLSATAAGKSKAEAGGKATKLARMLAKDPLVASLLPPGSASALEKAAKIFDDKRAGRAITSAGKGAAKLVRSLF